MLVHLNGSIEGLCLEGPGVLLVGGGLHTVHQQPLQDSQQAERQRQQGHPHQRQQLHTQMQLPQTLQYPTLTNTYVIICSAS